MLPKGILVVDVQASFISGPRDEDIASRIESAVPRFRHIVATQFLNHPLSMFRERLDWHAMTPGSEEALLAIKLPKRAIVLPKYGYAPAQGTEIVFKTYKLDRVALAGFDLDACVLAAAFSLWDHGIQPVLLEDLSVSRIGGEEVIKGLFRRQFGPDSVMRFSETVGA